MYGMYGWNTRKFDKMSEEKANKLTATRLAYIAKWQNSRGIRHTNRCRYIDRTTKYFQVGFRLFYAYAVNVSAQ